MNANHADVGRLDLPEADAYVVGSGPNGLAAAIAIAREGFSTCVVEQADTIGGGVRSAALTLPGFLHDVCSAIHPLGLSSPFLGQLPLAEHGLEWIHPTLPLAHPFDDGSAAVLEHSLAKTARSLGADGEAYTDLMEPLVGGWDELQQDVLRPLHWPRHPRRLARFGVLGLRSVQSLVARRFKERQAQALFAGMGAHGFLPLDAAPSAAIALVLGILGHVASWPVVAGGAQAITRALASYLRTMNGQIVTGVRVDSVDQLPPAKAVLLDLTPRQVLQLAGHRFSRLYRRQLSRYRYGPGVFKIDWALDGPIPWRCELCRGAGTVHVGGTLEEIAEGEQQVAHGRHPDRPFVLVAQQSLFDPTRAPPGKHTGWAYCHVPSGSTLDMTGRIEAQVERFAPGFRKLILARHTRNCLQMEQYNPNCVGGDINGGVQDLRQLFTRPAFRINPYKTSDERIFICSSSTPPGGGVHGLCGYNAAQAALRRLRADQKR